MKRTVCFLVIYSPALLKCNHIIKLKQKRGPYLGFFQEIFVSRQVFYARHIISITVCLPCLA